MILNGALMGAMCDKYGAVLAIILTVVGLTAYAYFVKLR